MFNYFGYDKVRHEVDFMFSAASEISEENREYDSFIMISAEQILFEFTDITEIFINKNGELSKRIPKPSNNSEWDNEGEFWHYGVDVLIKNKKQEIDTACRLAIVGGFDCTTSLGSYHYPTKATDQANLSSSVLDSVITTDPEWTTLFWCRDNLGQWSFKEHNTEQIQSVGRQIKQHILNQMTKKVMIQNQIDSISVEDPDIITKLSQIVWD